MRDIKLAIRFLRKKPGWTVAAALTLAIGISGATLTFSLLDQAFWRPLGFPEGDDLITLYARSSGRYSGIRYNEYLDFRDALEPEADIAAFRRRFLTVGGGQFPEQHQGELVSGNFFSVLQVPAQLGRTIIESDNLVTSPPVVVLSHILWRTQFAAEPNIVGQEIMIASRSHQVIGVAPPGFRGAVWPTFKTAFWIPVLAATDSAGAASMPGGVYQTIGRHHAGDGLEALQARIEPLDELLSRDRVTTYRDTGNPWRVAVLPGNYLRLWPEFRGQVGRFLLVLVLMAVCAGLVGCANVATLLLARSIERRHELAIRRSLGGGTLDLARRIGVEVLVLVVIGAIGAVAIIYALSPWVALLPLGVPYELDLVPDRRVLLIGGAISALTALLFAAFPLAHSLRGRLTLLVSERTVSGGGEQAMKCLVVAQVALSLALLASCGLLIRSALNTSAIDLGFRAGYGVSAVVSVPDQFPEEAVVPLIAELLESLRNEAIVEAASASRTGILAFVPRTRLHLETSPVSPPAEIVEAQYLAVSRHYFRTMGIPILAGRDFDSAEEAEAPVALVSRTFGERFWPGANPVGQRVLLESEDQFRRIVGIVGDVAQRDIRLAADPTVYIPYSQRPSVWTHVGVRTKADGGEGLRLLRMHLGQVDPTLAVSEPRQLDELQATATQDDRVQAILATSVAAVATTLAIIGIYGLLGYVVGRRERELAIRSALGATPREIVRLVLRRACGLAAVGILIGSGVSLLATRGLAGLLYGVEPNDPSTFVMATVILGAAAITASISPALRAARVDPAEVLRVE